MKRKWFGVVLLGLGAFLLVTGILAVTWAPGVVKKTPLDVNQVTYLDGTVKKLNASTGELEENPVKVESISKADSDASNDNDIVWVQTACVVIDVDNPPNCVDGDDERLISASTDVFATDRVTAEAIPDYPGLPADAIPHHGLVNKWPFDSEKKDYEYWDTTVEEAVPAVYTGTKDILGIETYAYTITIKDAPIEIADGINGTYDNVVVIYVEPKTGAIQQQTESMQQYLDDGTEVVDLNIQFTDQQMQDFADDAVTNIRLLDAVTLWVPIAGFVGGALCVVAGALLLLGSRRRDGHDDPAPSEPVAAGV